jgi:hypothetical protein
MDAEFDEDTSNPNIPAARKAWMETRTGEVDTSAAIEESRRLVQEVRSLRERNHFADKFREIIQGSRGAA